VAKSPKNILAEADFCFARLLPPMLIGVSVFLEQQGAVDRKFTIFVLGGSQAGCLRVPLLALSAYLSSGQTLYHQCFKELPESTFRNIFDFLAPLSRPT
jgi:hypothetical protein